MPDIQTTKQQETCKRFPIQRKAAHYFGHVTWICKESNIKFGSAKLAYLTIFYYYSDKNS